MSNNASFSISELAKEYGVSERTIRYDLEEIDDFLNENEFSPLERVIKMEILLPSNKADKNKLFKLLSKDNEKNYIYTSEERIDIMTLILGLSKDYVTLNKLSHVLDVSRGTIKNDLKKLKRELSFLNLSIESMPHYGIKIVGNELNIRKRIVYLLFHRFKLLSTSKVLKENAVPLGDNIYEEILANLGNIHLNYLKKLVGVVEIELDKKISYDSFSLLFYYLLSMVIRLKNGFTLNKDSSNYKSLLGSIEYRAASTIKRLIKYKDDSFIISQEETGIIAELISGSQIMHTDDFYLEKDVKLRIIVKHLISDVSKKTNIDLTRDSHLFYSLLEHLRPALQRFDNQAFISNNIVQEIRTDYKELFIIVSESLALLELGTEEIAYLTIHFLSSIERLLPKKQKKPKVLLVCNSGIGTVNLIEARVKKNLEVYIVDAIPLHDLERTLQMDKVDLIISTIRIFVMDIPCIFVNPFITEEDLDNIQQNLFSIKQRNRSVNNRLKDYFSNCPYSKTDKKRGNCANAKEKDVQIGVVYEPMLKDVLTVETTRLKVKVDDWEETVKKGGELLLQNGYIEQPYIDAMIQSVRDNGPYIVIASGIAMPHARPGEFVNKIGFSLITLQNPVNFGHKKNDPVSTVISLCGVDHSTHLRALQGLMKYLNDGQFLELLKNETEEQKIIDYINKK